jgi:catecholate siderophore receptor
LWIRRSDDLQVSSHETNIDEQLNGNFQFDIGPVHHTLIGGFELARQTSDPTRYVYGRTTTSLINPSPPVGGPPSFSISTIAAAVVNDAGVYAVDTANLGQHFDVIFGWRWDRYESTFRQSGTTNVNARRNEDLPSYRAALVFKPTSYGSIYVDYGTSFDPSAEALSLSAATASVAPAGKWRSRTSRGIWRTWNWRDAIHRARWPPWRRRSRRRSQCRTAPAPAA